jgi:hypothetical protein
MRFKGEVRKRKWAVLKNYTIIRADRIRESTKYFIKARIPAKAEPRPFHRDCTLKSTKYY